MRDRLVRYVMLLLKKRRTLGRLLFWAVFGLGAYAISLLTFLAGSSQDGALVSNPGASTEDWYSIELKTIDYVAQRIEFDLKINLPEGRGTITKCLHFGAEEWRLGGYSGSLSAVLVNLKELPRDSLQPDERPGPGWTTYRGNGDFFFWTDLRMFPFDKVWWDFSISEQCWTPGAIDSTTFNLLSVSNHIPDYYLSLRRGSGNMQRENQSHPQFVLRRSLFLRILTTIIFAAAFASSIALILQASGKAKDFSLLTYFVGLWAIRSILLSPIQGLKAFPTLIEITILFLFCFTILGVFLTSRFVALTGKNHTNIPSNDPRGET